ncbi:hypothetical protein M8C21_024344 [Ambrosia artemisiifolia]|uniref:Uncharacterized protein n=1 Tax=Ambrosia artemisiifolia TaxID=4212 RepID=A0AAD5BPX1_AMBAR|nr:hypothetical protein M8C21_024344 [Ambrosia artemisiifolia]
MATMLKLSVNRSVVDIKKQSMILVLLAKCNITPDKNRGVLLVQRKMSWSPNGSKGQVNRPQWGK